MSINVELLRQTFERAKNENGGVRTLGLAFYERLFTKYPQVKPMFKTPPEEQHKKLMASVGAILAALTNPDALMPYLRAMGLRHVEYGTQSGHYEAVAENLVAVLGKHLSAEGEWTSEMQSAWQEALKTD
jgi:methyl-accepting chemotaxis protein